MKKVYKLDKMDKQILALLQQNAKITNARLSKAVGLSAASTLDRVRKLEQRGFVEGYYTRLSSSHLGFGCIMLVWVTLGVNDKVQRRHFLQFVQESASVCDCYHVAGACHFVLKVITKDPQAYEAWLTDLSSSVKGGAQVTSMVVLSGSKEGAHPLP